MSYIIFIFIIIVFHICVDYCKAQAARLEASDLAKNSALIATAPNNIGCGTILRIQITMTSKLSLLSPSAWRRTTRRGARSSSGSRRGPSGRRRAPRPTSTTSARPSSQSSSSSSPYFISYSRSSDFQNFFVF